MKLIVTLPPIYREELLEEVIEHPLVYAVRYNTGMSDETQAEEILNTITKLTTKHKKLFGLDLKGRQLRIASWSLPPYGPILLNHKIEVSLPAKVYFRGDNPSLVKKITNGNEIYIDPPPKFAVGAGQSVNIVSPELRTTDGYFTKKDCEFIRAAKKFGVKNFLFSFVESQDDVALFERALSKIPGARKILKIESEKGWNVVKGCSPGSLVKKDLVLMAARDDLVVQVGGIRALKASQDIVKVNPDAICASRLLMGLESEANEVTLADIADLDLMRSYGYQYFMLSDGISHRHFTKAMEFWTEYVKSIEK